MKKTKEHIIKKIISGGQTGADRAGLDAAKELGIKTGGYCPKGFLTENGQDKSLRKFGLEESDTQDYNERTVKNVEASDGTVIFSIVSKTGSLLRGGSLLTLSTARNSNKPVIINPSPGQFRKWLIKNNIKILNISGNRESLNPGIYEKVKLFLIKSLSGVPSKR